MSFVNNITKRFDFNFNVDTTLRCPSGVNQVTLLGRVGATPVARGSAEHPVTIFQVATSRSYKVEHVDDDSSSSSSSNPKQQYEQRTEWHRVSVFRKGLREVAATILSKGDRVYLTGSIHYSTFKDANSGQTVYSTSIIAGHFILKIILE